MFFGWNALQGYLAPDGRVVALCPENTISNDLKYIPRIVYPTALDVASSGPSTDYCTIAIDYSSRALYHWTFSNPVARALSAFGAIADHDFIECNIRFTRVWAGEAHFLALDQNGILYSWGSGRHGQLGHGDLVSKSNPQPVESLEGIRIVDAACGAFFSVALSGNV
ncbi:RCC1 domain-containing protein 1 [Linnemannia zychae]|nr:RCC1 domain-containing protein 1 [Linnemannia zychae]